VDHSADDTQKVCTCLEHLVWLHVLIPDSSVTTVLAGMFSDGLLACRFYVVYSRQFWLLCLSFATVGGIGRTLSSIIIISSSFCLHLSTSSSMTLSDKLI
jgi:hypothetical protein